MPSLSVGADRFKAYQPSDNNHAVSNQALATSKSGSLAVAELGRHIVRKIDGETRTEEARRKYFSDCPANKDSYNTKTLRTTGPAVLRDPELVDTLRRNCGISNDLSSLVMIPYTRYPYPTLEERDHSWMAVSTRNSLETTGPRRRPDSPERGPSATEPTIPVQRSPTRRSSAVTVSEPSGKVLGHGHRHG
jgi:hypothetical protein